MSIGKSVLVSSKCIFLNGNIPFVFFNLELRLIFFYFPSDKLLIFPFRSFIISEISSFLFEGGFWLEFQIVARIGHILR